MRKRHLAETFLTVWRGIIPMVSLDLAVLKEYLLAGRISTHFGLPLCLSHVKRKRMRILLSSSCGTPTLPSVPL
jgi:hypothetical protein